ncbi:hypothetical protein QEH56_04650 [Pelagicoccus enzymogenes]|uniref:hypothetical protein n=1 Tax=Pelagicoccus enzymogenes TaxID=2773457 RepID=UPI00280E12DA|nr:hypothetical protein [Pelagicoccus enzymogenes]MDQ8197423.1 hypothetical protein [Pelagicoccus enzymogenes]
MKTFHIKILTKLGSTQYKTIQAETESEALRKAEVKFPLHKEISITEEPRQAAPSGEPDLAFERNLAEVKLRSREKKARSARREGWGFMIGGVALQGLLLFAGFVTLWLAIPIIWGVSRIAYGSSERGKVQEALQALDTPA